MERRSRQREAGRNSWEGFVFFLNEQTDLKVLKIKKKYSILKKRMHLASFGKKDVFI